jgi:hypothetical protein
MGSGNETWRTIVCVLLAGNGDVFRSSVRAVGNLEVDGLTGTISRHAQNSVGCGCAEIRRDSHPLGSPPNRSQLYFTFLPS